MSSAMIDTDDQVSENVVINARADLWGYLQEQRRNGCVTNLQFFLAWWRVVEVQEPGRAFPIVFLCACAGRHCRCVECESVDARGMRVGGCR